MKYNTPPMQ